MTELSKQLEDNNYLKALKSTDNIETPAKGFVKPSEHSSSTFDLLKVVVKQNNTLISLLLSQGELIQELRDQIDKLKKQQQQPPPEAPSKELEVSIEQLTKRLSSLNLGN